MAIDAFDTFMILNDVEYPRRNEVAIELLRQHEVEEMNREYPSILVGGSKFRFAHIVMTAAGSLSYRFLASPDYKLMVSNMPGVYQVSPDESGGAKVSLKSRYEWWLNETERLMFSNIFFEPVPIAECLDPGKDRFHKFEENGNKHYFNLFSGWPTRPSQGDWSLTQWHIKNALCGGDQAHYEYFLDWLAHILQYPAVKPNVALVLRGRKGTGKSMIMSAIAKALGPLGMVISHSKHLTGSFNSHLREKIFALVEESFFSGSPAEEGVLKHLISDVNTTYEAKGYDAEPGLSFLRVCLVTNSDWAAPASEDERRFFIPTVTDAAILRNNEEGGTYFSRLAQEIAGGGISALFHDLMNRSISESDVRRAPDTEELQRQKLLTLSGIGAWLLDTMMKGALTADKGSVPVALESYPRHTSVKVEFILDSLDHYLKVHDSSRSQLMRVREQLAEIFPIKNEMRGADLHIVFPPLEQMREAFCAHYRVPPQW
jgi:hypothetical protein